MKQGMVRDFLNLPGVLGVVFMDGHSRPFFCGLDRNLNSEQKEVLVQGILQIIGSTPDDFESFELQFLDHKVYIYKLGLGVIFLVLTDKHLSIPEYQHTIRLLKTAITEDIKAAVDLFRLQAGNATLTNRKPVFSQANDEEPTAGEQLAPRSPRRPPKAPTFQEVLPALNHISQLATRSLGVAVVVNYWKSTRVPAPEVQKFQIERSGRITLPMLASEELSQTLSPGELEGLQTWTMQFIERCAHVNREFPALVRDNALPHIRNLLPHI